MKPERDFEDEICSKVTVTQLEAIINDLKVNRALGVHGITSNMLKLSSLAFKTKLTDLVNDVLLVGRGGSKICTHWQNDTNRYERAFPTDSEEMPSIILCVTSIMLSMFTKILHARIDKSM